MDSETSLPFLVDNLSPDDLAQILEGLGWKPIFKWKSRWVWRNTIGWPWKVCQFDPRQQGEGIISGCLNHAGIHWQEHKGRLHFWTDTSKGRFELDIG